MLTTTSQRTVTVMLPKSPVRHTVQLAQHVVLRMQRQDLSAKLGWTGPGTSWRFWNGHGLRSYWWHLTALYSTEIFYPAITILQ